MRDDVKNEADALLSAYRLKLDLLNRMLGNEIERYSKIISNDFDAVLDLLKQNEDIMMTVDETDYAIAHVYDNMKNNFGFSSFFIKNIIHDSKDSMWHSVRNTQNEIEKIFNKINYINSSAELLLNGLMDNIAKEMNEISIIRKLQNNLQYK